MKKLSTLFLFISLSVLSANADNLVIKEATVTIGSETATEVTMSLEGSDRLYTAVQTTITLPEGFAFAKSTGRKPVYATKLSNSPLFYDADEPADHTIASGETDGVANSINVAVASTTSCEFYAYSGDLFKFYVIAQEGAKEGPVEITLSGAKLIPVSGTTTVLETQIISDKVTAVGGTGIRNVSTADTDSKAAYNIVGQRVPDSANGIVIKSGKKYLNK